MRRAALLTVFLVACTDGTIQTQNPPPEVAILEPAPDAVLPEGEAVTARGHVEDRGTDPLDLEVTWSSSQDGLLWEGSSAEGDEVVVALGVLSPGEHSLTLRAIDPDGASATDTITVTVMVVGDDDSGDDDTGDDDTATASPTCVITAPPDGGSAVDGDPLVLRGIVTDADTAPASLSAQWSSSLDGALGPSTVASDGETAIAPSLAVGTHLLTLLAVDPEGHACSDFIALTIEAANQRPSIGTPTVSPDPLHEGDTANCAAPSAVDPDGDATTVAQTWLVSGVDPGVAGPSLSSFYFDKGDDVVCVATASDAGGPGAPSVSSSVLVLDTPPTAPAVSITPSNPIAQQDALRCSITSGSTDADGDPVSYAVTWTVNAVAWTGGTTTTTLPGDGIAATATAAGQLWTCAITPTAAAASGPAGTASVTISAPPPVGKLVFVTSVAYTGNLGGIAGADSKCMARAAAAGLNGTFEAWISTGSSGPSARMTHATQPYVRLDGQVVANDWTDLTDGTIQNPINVNEFGVSQPSPSFVYSFTRIDGTPGLFGSAGSNCYGGDCHCQNWTTATQGNPTPGSAVAQVSNTNDDWTDYSFGNFCGGSYGIYCFEQ